MTRLTAVSSRDVDIDTGETAAQQNHADALAQQARAQQMQQAATQMLLTAIKALGQRFVVALANLYGLLTVASAFYLWAVALPDITTLKIIGCSIYSGFILLLNVYGRRK